MASTFHSHLLSIRMPAGSVVPEVLIWPGPKYVQQYVVIEECVVSKLLMMVVVFRRTGLVEHQVLSGFIN